MNEDFHSGILEEGEQIKEAIDQVMKDRGLIKPEEVKARYKIEVHFGKDRSISAIKPSTGAILIWESGKEFHGGGDDKMYWCGWDDCNKPIRSSAMAEFHLVCPHCQRENFLDPLSKKQHVDEVKRRGQPVRSFQAMPCIVGEKLFKLAPKKLAALLAKTWYDLDCDADIYAKYHPLDIRRRPETHGIVETIDGIQRAREKRSLMIYPLKNILKDTSAGADLEVRLLAFVTA